MSRTQAAIFYMLAAMFALSAMNVALRSVSVGLHSTQIVVLRQVFSIIFVCVWASALSRGIPNFRTTRLQGHFWRATFGICAMELWFHSVSIMPVTLVTALSFTTPIFSTIFALLFLGEKAGIRRWGAIFTGFLGMLIILRPDISGISPDALFVIGASIMMAVAGIMVKTLSSSEPPETIVFYMALFMLPWSIIPAIPFWQDFTLNQAVMVAVVALFSTAAHLLMARAFARAELVALMPYDFTRLIFTALMAYAFFGEAITINSIIGALVIVGSTVYIAHRESLKKRMETTIVPEL
jgi:S-adenosylmethionine uptake transporter